MRKIKLTQGFEVLIDEEDFPRVRKYHWCPFGKRGSYYAGSKEKGAMHRFILRLRKGSKTQVHHINGNLFDNQKANLVKATVSNSQRTSKKKKGTSSQYKGVYWHKRDKMWIANIRVNYKQKCLGYFDYEMDAARAYDKAALELYKYAKVNFWTTQWPCHW
tara:strand:+ start:162 stop:644 length:483 start_codon:yes stop_codon:yes gene_type:complete